MATVHLCKQASKLYLSVVLEDVDPDYGIGKGRVGALHQVIIQVLLVLQLIQALENELEQSSQVLWGRSRYKDVAVAQAQCSSNGQTQRC